jgi:hypothetical protein
MVEKPIFKYLDYRDFLKDHYEYSKKRHGFFSFRYIAFKTGLDASFYVKVLQKQQHLSLKSLPAIVNFLGFKKNESKYFNLLVRYNRTKQEDEARIYLEKLTELQRLPANKNDSDDECGCTFVTTDSSENYSPFENLQFAIHQEDSSFNCVSKLDRAVSNVTINLSKKYVNTLNERLREFSKELLEIAKMEQEPDSVFQINFQILPLASDGEQQGSI